MRNQFITTRTQWLLLRPFAMRGIYLSGPISADPGTAPERFQKARDFIAEVFGPDQPIASPIGITLDNPDVPPSIVDPNRYTHPLYMIECYKYLMACNVIVLLPGWEDSKGAVYEARFAESLGIVPIFITQSSDGLAADLTFTFRAVTLGDWVSDARLSRQILGFEEGGFDVPDPEHVNPVPIGGDPNPFGAPVDGAIAQAMEDASRMAGADGCPHDYIAP